MVAKINIKPNTFYRKKTLDDDVAVMPVYGDAFIGLGTTLDLVSTPDTTYFLGESTVITENDFPYDAGKLSEIYLSLYTNTLTQTNPQTAPFVDVYSLSPNVDLTEGDLSLINYPASTSDVPANLAYTGPITAYVSAYDFGTPWLVEDFDGTNKSFQELKQRADATGFTSTEDGDTLIISIGNYADAIYSTHEAKGTDKHTGWLNPKNWKERGKQGLDWGQSTVGNTLYKTFELLPKLAAWTHNVGYGIAKGAWGTEASEYTKTTSTNMSTNEVMTTILKGFGLPDQVRLEKASDGLYYTTAQGNFLGANLRNQDRLTRQFFGDVLTEGHSRSWWIGRGAIKRFNYSTNASFEYEEFEASYVDRCTADNSIFSQVYKRGNARDIKVETIGSAGDNEDFFAYVTANLVNNDTATEGNAVKFTLYWENYVGTSIKKGNAFGYNSTGTGIPHPIPQCVYGHITDVPMPTLFDIATPALTSSCAPEFEFKFKINSMSTLPYAGVDSVLGREISRSFTFIMSYLPIDMNIGDPHMSAEQLGALVMNDDTIAINFCKTDTGNEIDVVGKMKSDADDGVSQNIDREDNTMPVYYSADVDADADYHTKIPEGEWITARLKFNDEVTASGSWASGNTGLLLYFPDLTDDFGQMKFVKVYSKNPIGRNGFWPGQWTFWANNMRSINNVPGSDTDTDINNYYAQIDDVPDDDKMVEVVLDRLSFYGWNTATKNCTNTFEGGMGDLIKIPTVKAIPVASSNAQISISATGSIGDPVADNYYGGFNQTIPSYLSFGYDNSGTAYAGVQHHELLFNDFFSTDSQNVLPIPSPYMKGGYFTSGNYGNHSQWFTNLSIGVSASANIQMGGAANYIDNFTQKGLMRVSSSFAGWVESGNPLVGARILTVSSDGTQITVDNGALFDTSLNQQWVIEVVGGRQFCEAGYNRYTFVDYLSGSGSKGYVTALRQAKPRNGNTIFLDKSILYDDSDGSFNWLGMSLLETSDSFAFSNDIKPGVYGRSSQLVMSPKKYWVNMAIANCTTQTATGTNAPVATWASPRNSGSGYEDFILTNFTMSSSTGTGSGAVIRAYVVNDGNIITLDSFLSIISGGTGYVVGDRIHFSSSTGLNSSAYITVGSITNGWGVWYNQASGGYAIPLAPRNYNTVVSVSGGAVRGTTFNENLYNDGIYANRWSLAYNNPDSSIVNTQINFGFGTAEEDEDGEVNSLVLGGGAGYMQRDYLLSGQNYLNLSTYARTVKPKYGDDFNFMVIPTFMNSTDTTYTINFDTAEGTNDAHLIYGIRNPVTPISKFKVSPILSKGGEWPSTTNVSLSWAEEAKNNNTWYRLLFVDNKNISNKYHNINFWAPLNEDGNTYGYYTSQTDTTTTAFSNSGNVSSSIEGFAGYGSNYSGANYLIEGDTTVLANDLSRWSFLAHCKPADTSGTVFDIATSLDVTGVSQFQVALSSSRIVVTHASSSTTLTSINSYDCNGIQPIAVAATFDKNIPDNNWKLYVNGKLEDTSDYTTDNINVSGGVCVGAQARLYTRGVAPFFTGMIEEITSHSGTTLYLPPNLNNYILDTKGYDDLISGATTNTSIDYTTRLFIMDGNNIRGKGVADVARSATASWKVTGI